MPCCFRICWYGLYQQTLTVVVFVRNWYIRNKTNNEDWSDGVRGISRIDFFRLVFTVLSVVFLYLPLSLYILSAEVSVPYHRFVWSNVHGPLYKYIIKVESTTGRAPWSSWIGIVLAITLFFFVGFTQNAKQSYRNCAEWIYDHLPAKFQVKATGMRTISDRCKDRRAARNALESGEVQIMHNVKRYGNWHWESFLTGSRPNAGTRAKNWFDADDDDEPESLYSSEATLQWRDEEEGKRAFQTGQSFYPTPSKSEVNTAGLGTTPPRGQGVTVTRQVVVETSQSLDGAQIRI